MRIAPSKQATVWHSHKWTILFQGQIEFSPPLPYNKQRLIHNMPPSHLTKFVASYATAFWRKAGLSGDMARSSCVGCCENNPIGITFDGTTSEGSPAIVGFITSYAAAKWVSVKVQSLWSKMVSVKMFSDNWMELLMLYWICMHRLFTGTINCQKMVSLWLFIWSLCKNVDLGKVFIEISMFHSQNSL